MKCEAKLKLVRVSRRPVLVVLAFLLMASALAALLRPSNDGSGPVTPVPDPSPMREGRRSVARPREAQPALVTRNVDGDTIWAEGGTLPPGPQRIRLLEIDAPESTNRGECFGREASAFAERELPVGARVHLLADRADRDRYGRYLRYVWDAEGELFNEKAVSQGYARARLYQPNDRFIAELERAEADAKRERRGMWGRCSASKGARANERTNVLTELGSWLGLPTK